MLSELDKKIAEARNYASGIKADIGKMVNKEEFMDELDKKLDQTIFERWFP